MANTPQAKKRIRRNARRTEVNGARVSRIRTFIKKVESAIALGDKSAAAAALAATVFASDADVTSPRPQDVDDQCARKTEEPEPVHDESRLWLSAVSQVPR